jgi:hypothetical protein
MVLACLALIAAVTRPAQALRRSATVAALVQAVAADQGELRQTIEELSGEVPASVGVERYTFLNRFCSSQTAIGNAERFVYEHLRADGLDVVRYQSYSAAIPGRNVIGEIRGATLPNEIVTIGAHLDDKSATSRAPGADDNASACAALLWMAKHFAGHRFARTIRFVFCGGEEAGHLGSDAYAAAARQAGRNLVAVFNADMYGRDNAGNGVVALHTRPLDGSSVAQQDLWTARQYLASVSIYGIPDLRPQVVSLGETWSDHESFWTHGYGATSLIEAQPFDNPYYHSAADTVAHLTWPYYVHVTQGFVATAAHIAYIGDTLPSGRMYVSGLGLRGLKSGAGYGVRARVRVRDMSFTPVLGAIVRGRFTGATSSLLSGRTNASGVAYFRSTERLRGGTWKFTVTGVRKHDWVYAEALNSRTRVSLRYPR